MSLTLKFYSFQKSNMTKRLNLKIGDKFGYDNHDSQNILPRSLLHWSKDACAVLNFTYEGESSQSHKYVLPNDEKFLGKASKCFQGKCESNQCNQ